MVNYQHQYLIELSNGCRISVTVN